MSLFGPFHVTQAVLPILRQQQAGHIIQISTIGGILAFPGLGGYHASKWALEGMSDSLAQEVAGFGIKVTLVEPGGFDTDWNNASATFAEPQPQYEPLHDGMKKAMAGAASPKPVGFGSAILKIVDAGRTGFGVALGHPLRVSSTTAESADIVVRARLAGRRRRRDARPVNVPTIC